MVKLTQVHKIQIYLFYSLGSIKKSLESWIYHLYLSSFLAQIFIPKIILSDTALGLHFTSARGWPVWPVMSGSYSFTPFTGHTVKILSLSPLHRHPFVLLSASRAQGTPLAIWSFNQEKGDPFVGFGPLHRPDRVPKPVHLHLLQNRALKVLYGLFCSDLLL